MPDEDQDNPAPGKKTEDELTTQECLRLLDEMQALGTDPGGMVADVMHPEFESAQPADSLESVFTRLFQGRTTAIPVLDGTRLVGLISRENLQEFLALRGARGRAQVAG